MASYDRLFPNQDTLPKGGFGNLTAQPLQHQARGQGNTLFVDDAFDPFSDQWGFLARLRKMTPAEVQDLAEAAARQGQVLGVRMSVLDWRRSRPLSADSTGGASWPPGTTAVKS